MSGDGDSYAEASGMAWKRIFDLEKERDAERARAEKAEGELADYRKAASERANENEAELAVISAELVGLGVSFAKTNAALRAEVKMLSRDNKQLRSYAPDPERFRMAQRAYNKRTAEMSHELDQLHVANAALRAEAERLRGALTEIPTLRAEHAALRAEVERLKARTEKTEAENAQLRTDAINEVVEWLYSNGGHCALIARAIERQFLGRTVSS